MGGTDWYIYAKNVASREAQRADRETVLSDIFGENDFLLKIPLFMCNTSFVKI